MVKEKTLKAKVKEEKDREGHHSLIRVYELIEELFERVEALEPEVVA